MASAKTKRMRPEPLRVKQICIGQWDGNTGRNFSVIALDEDGKVYRFSIDSGVWVPYCMSALEG